jgi:hypothetical protein
MSVFVANFFRQPTGPVLLAVVLLGALGPALLHARGGRAFWFTAAGICLAVAVAKWLRVLELETFWLGYLAT